MDGKKIRKRKRDFSVPEYQEGVKAATKVGLDFSLEFFATNRYFFLQLISTIKQEKPLLILSRGCYLF